MKDPIREAIERPDFWYCESAIPHCPVRAPVPIYGNARWASAADLARVLHGSDDPCIEFPHVAPLIEGSDGLELLPKERLHLSRDLVTRNLLVVGQVGSGKSQELIVPALFGTLRARPDASVVCVDTKGDLFDTVATWADEHRTDLDVRCLNFTNPARSEGYNPHDPTNDRDPVDAAHTLVHAAERRANRDSQFWADWSARIATALQYVNGRVYGRSSPGLIHHQLEQPMSALITLLSEHKDLPYVASVVEFLGHPHSNSDTVLADARNRFAAWRDEALDAVTSNPELGLHEITKSPTVLVIEADEAELHRTRQMISTFFAQLQRFVLRESNQQPANRLPRPLVLLIDEFATLGRIPTMPQFLNSCRSRNVGVVAAVQSLGQIRSTYGDEGEDVIAGFSSKVFLSPVNLEDAEYASRLSGTMTIAAPLDVESGSTGWSNSVCRPEPRSLLLREELLVPVRHPLLGAVAHVFLADTTPFRCYFRAAYDTPGTREIIAMMRQRGRQPSLRVRPLEVEHPRARWSAAGRTCHPSWHRVASGLDGFRDEEPARSRPEHSSPTAGAVSKQTSRAVRDAGARDREGTDARPRSTKLASILMWMAAPYRFVCQRFIGSQPKAERPSVSESPTPTGGPIGNVFTGAHGVGERQAATCLRCGHTRWKGDRGVCACQAK